MDDGLLVGFAVLAGLRDRERIEPRRLAVAPRRRHAGRGRALLRAVLARAHRHHGAGRVWLDVKALNSPARTLYESENFVITEVLRGRVSETDGGLFDLVVMEYQP